MLIVEDDPYYFLQFEKVQRSTLGWVLKSFADFYSAPFCGSRGLPRFSPWTLTGGSSGLTPSLRSCPRGELVNLGFPVNVKKNRRVNLILFSILFCVLCLQAQNRFCDRSQTAGRQGGAAHPGLHNAHKHLHTGKLKVQPFQMLFTVHSV